MVRNLYHPSTSTERIQRFEKESEDGREENLHLGVDFCFSRKFNLPWRVAPGPGRSTRIEEANLFTEVGTTRRSKLPFVI